MTDHDIEELVEVTQADRIVAAETSGEFYTLGFHDDVLSGLRDDHSYVQTIARHRAQALTTLQAENARLTLDNLQLKKWWAAERKRGEKLMLEIESLTRQALKDRAG